MGNGRNLLVNAALFFGTLLLCVVAAELVLRATGIYGVRIGTVTIVEPVDDPVLDYRQVPGAEFHLYGNPYRINAKGWRDHEYEYEKAGGVIRIVMLGDSVLNGHGVHLEDVYGKQLERRLNESSGGPRYEVIMLAIGALNTRQEAHLLEIEGLRYDPDLVVVGYVLNDPDAASSYKESRKRKASMGWFHNFKQKLKTSSLVFHSFRLADNLRWRISTAGGAQDGASYIDSDMFSRLHEDPERWGEVVDAFAKMRTLCEPRGIEVVVAIFPIIYKLDRYRWTGIHSQVAEAANAQGLRVLDLLESYRAHNERDTRLGSGDHIHPNAVGHRVACDALYDYLIRERLVPVRERVPLDRS